MGRRAAPLSPPEIAGLTRLALSFSLGRGSICVVTRSFSLQLYQPRSAEDYIWYQWRRLAVFLPTIRQPRLHEAVTGLADEDGSLDGKAAQWRLRVSSVHLQAAWRMLHPSGPANPLQGSNNAPLLITPECLSMLGIEAMAALWADRGRLHQPRGNPHAQGRLNLSRYDWASAATIQRWISHLAGADSKLAENPRSSGAPMLFFEHSELAKLLGQMSDTWMAQAGCLERKFRTQESREWSEEMLAQRLSVYMPEVPEPQEVLNDAGSPVPTLPIRKAGRLVPSLPSTGGDDEAW